MVTRDDLQAVADLMCQGEGIDPLHVRVKKTRRGHAHGKRGWVGVPQWATEEAREYACYYVIHEVCHVVSGERLHTAQFKAVECRWLEAFGMRPVYRGAYARELLSTKGGSLWSCETSKYLRPRSRPQPVYPRNPAMAMRH